MRKTKKAGERRKRDEETFLRGEVFEQCFGLAVVKGDQTITST